VDLMAEDVTASAAAASSMVEFLGADSSRSRQQLCVQLNYTARATGNDTVVCDESGTIVTCSCGLQSCEHLGYQFSHELLDRARSGPLHALWIGTLIMVAILTPMMLFAPTLVRLFNQEAEVIAFGTLFIRLISPFYLLCTINQIYSGALRGVGDTKATMIIMLFSFVFFRQLYLFTAYRLGGGIVPIALGYPAGWIMCSTVILIYYYRFARQRALKKVAQNPLQQS
jgi:hypothetical protein